MTIIVGSFFDISVSLSVARCPFAFLLGKADIQINTTRSVPLLRCCGIKVSSPKGVDSVDDESAKGDAAGLAARINHSSNLREITPCNRSPGFVISAQSAIKRPRCIVVSFGSLAETTANRMFRLIGAKRPFSFLLARMFFGMEHRTFPASLPSSRYYLYFRSRILASKRELR